MEKQFLHIYNKVNDIFKRQVRPEQRAIEYFESLSIGEIADFLKESLLVDEDNKKMVNINHDNYRLNCRESYNSTIVCKLEDVDNLDGPTLKEYFLVSDLETRDIKLRDI